MKNINFYPLFNNYNYYAHDSNSLITWVIYFSLFALSWFYGNIKRPEAEKLLLSPPNEHGAFLIRDNTKDKPSYALSIRDGDVAKHYRIRTTDEGEYFIARHQLLHSLKELVEHYSHNADGLCDMLKKPAVDVSAS